MYAFAPLQRKLDRAHDAVTSRKAARYPAANARADAKAIRAAWREPAARGWLPGGPGIAQPIARDSRSWPAPARCDLQAEPSSIQTKLDVSQPGDALEQEADRVAERVMRMPLEEVVPKRPETTNTSSHSNPNVVQRACSSCANAREDDNNPVQRWADRLHGGVATPEWSQRLHAVQAGGGDPLPLHLRHYMEPRFGIGFDHVRVHHDARASELAESTRPAA